ncbi:hypothetical protein [Oryzibacter oryziterrae]|uniref:hypothetical protein n=1 Tax=Oryzibacter oryziterrae TaxID=2766474 RepID=UPI001F2140DF|nr:hypothetical protein [Oryzibacter oryziterrae]
MLARFDSIIRAIVHKIALEETQLCQRIGTSIHDEDDFTSRLADRIENAIDGVIDSGYRWNVVTRKLPWRGSSSEEKQYGADLMIVLSVNSPDFSVSKGVLVQAKILQNVRELMTNFMYPTFTLDNHLRGQIQNMLQITPESFVWVYAEPGVRVMRAGTLAGCGNHRTVLEVENRSLANFMGQFLSCWHGDYRFAAADKNSLETVAREYNAKRAVLISATSDRDSGRE